MTYSNGKWFDNNMAYIRIALAMLPEYPSLDINTKNAIAKEIAPFIQKQFSKQPRYIANKILYPCCTTFWISCNKYYMSIPKILAKVRPNVVNRYSRKIQRRN